MRNSPSLAIFENLIKKHKNISYHDNFVKKISIKGKMYSSKNLTKSLIEKMDALLLTTDHSYLNKKFIYSNAKIIF